MNKQLAIMFTAALCAGATGCRTTAPEQAEQSIAWGGDNPTAAVIMPRHGSMVRGGARSHVPMAVIYRTNGDWNNHVAINLNAEGTAPLSFPAPTDVSVDSAPLPVGGGWLLDRRGGTGLNTVFLTWTYAEYAALKEAPTVAELMAHIIPGARVTDIRQLDIPAAQARQDTLKSYKF